MSRIVFNLSRCLLAITFSCSGASGAVLFQDTFDRPDSRNLDGSLLGIINNTGGPLVADDVYRHGFIDPANTDAGGNLQEDAAGTNGGGTQIVDGKLELASGFGTSNLFVNHNFINPDILAAGGFSVSIDITRSQNNSGGLFGGGIAIGMSLAEALDTGDALNGQGSSNGFNKMTDAFRNNTSGAVSDFWLAIRTASTFSADLVWGGRGQVGQPIIGDQALLGSAPVSLTGTITAAFAFDDFNDGSQVQYEVFYNGDPKGTGSFTWSGSNENYIGVDGRQQTGVEFDNLRIASLPEPSSFMVALIAVVVEVLTGRGRNRSALFGRRPLLASLPHSGDGARRP